MTTIGLRGIMMKTNIYLFAKNEKAKLEAALGKLCAKMAHERFPVFTQEMSVIQGQIEAYETIINLMEDK